MNTKTFSFADQFSRELNSSINSPQKQNNECHYFINLPQNHSFEAVNEALNNLVDRYSDITLDTNWIKKSSEGQEVYSSILKIETEWTIVNYYVADDIIFVRHFIQKDVESIKEFETFRFGADDYISFSLNNLIFMHTAKSSALNSILANLGFESRRYMGDTSYQKNQVYGNSTITISLLILPESRLLHYESGSDGIPIGIRSSFEQLKDKLEDNYIGTSDGDEKIYRILVGNKYFHIGLSDSASEIAAQIVLEK